MAFDQQAAHAGNEIVATTGGQDQVAQLLKGAYSERATSWADTAFPAGTTSIDLDQVYPRIVKSSLVALERPGAFVVRRVATVIETPRADFGVAARVTRLTFAAGDAAGFSPRTTNVLGQSEPLALAGAPLPDLVADVDALDLARAVPEIAPGRTLAITGVDADGAPVSEVATVKLIEAGVGAGPRLRLEQRLVNTYRRTSLRVLANVARATHGDSRAEVLGSGDQRAAFQTMTLRQRPLTHVSASTPSGTQSTLAIWVAGVRWAEVPTLYGQPPDARVYTTRRADDGTVTVTFGDGRTGARLPSGRDNVVATYRVGIGLAAVLDRERISIPLARPLGLQNIVNPVAAAGADDPEVLASARTNAPLAVRTLGRIVSVLDYEDLARAFAGIGKARADVIWDGERRLVHLTVTGPQGAAIDPTSGTAVDLKRAIDAVRHVTVAVEIASYRSRPFAVDARLVLAPDRRPADVIDEATATLLDRFSFDRQQLAVPLPVSEVYATLQAVPGVVGVLLEAFHDDNSSVIVQDVIDAFPAQPVPGGGIAPAELVTIDPLGIHLVEAVTVPAGAPNATQQPGGELMIDADVLWERLPAAMRARDAETGGVLRALVEVLAGQAAAVADDIEALQDDWFIETCAEWVVPYIGELVGTRALHPLADAAGFSNRAQVADTLAVPAPQGNGGDARGPRPGEHRLQRPCRGVLRDAVDDAARQPRAPAGTRHRRRSRRQRDGAGARSVRHHPAHRRRADDGRRVRLAQPAQHRAVRLAGAVVPARPGDRGGGRPTARWSLAGRPPRRRPGDGRADGRRDVDRPPRRGGERARPATPPPAARRARRAPRRPVGAAPGRPVVRPRRSRGGRVDPGHAGDRADERAARPPLRRRPERLVAPDRPGGAPRPGARSHRRVADPCRRPRRGVVALRLQRRRRRRPVSATRRQPAGGVADRLPDRRQRHRRTRGQHRGGDVRRGGRRLERLPGRQVGAPRADRGDGQPPLRRGADVGRADPDRPGQPADDPRRASGRSRPTGRATSATPSTRKASGRASSATSR